MATHLAKRLILLLPVLLGISVLVFLLMHMIPGDPALVLLGQEASETEIARLREALGLEQPLLKQFGLFVLRLVQGDLGTSIFQQQPVADLVFRHMPATIELSVAALLITVVIAVPLGILSAVKQFSLFDYGTMVLAQVGVSMPIFWLGILLILGFALNLNWFPFFGRGEPLMAALVHLFKTTRADMLWDSLAHLVLPAVALGASSAALTTRMVRSAMLEVLSADYIRTARAKGLSERVIVYRHAFRNAMIPVVTILGLQFGQLLGGAVVTETVFAWPGLGQLAVTAISQRDFPLVQGTVLVIALTFSLINLAIDSVYVFINPRIRYS